jgi:hypothetical protein
MDEQIILLGLSPEQLTESQKEIILQPINAPENYMQDGEITGAEAKINWEREMKNEGFTALQIFNIARKLGI